MVADPVTQSRSLFALWLLGYRFAPRRRHIVSDHRLNRADGNDGAFAATHCDGDGAKRHCDFLFFYVCDWLNGGRSDRVLRDLHAQHKRRAPAQFQFTNPQTHRLCGCERRLARTLFENAPTGTQPGPKVHARRQEVMGATRAAIRPHPTQKIHRFARLNDRTLRLA